MKLFTLILALLAIATGFIAYSSAAPQASAPFGKETSIIGKEAKPEDVAKISVATWDDQSGKAKIFSWERSWYPVHPALKDGTPYMTVLVELPDAGNVRMVGNLLGDPMQQIIIGSDVECVFEDHDDVDKPFTLVQWRVVE